MGTIHEKIDINTITINLKVAGLRRFKLRMKVAGWIIGLAAKVGGFNLTWEDSCEADKECKYYPESCGDCSSGELYEPRDV